MKKGTITLLVIGVLILIMVGGTLTTYNGLIAKDEAVATAWGNIQSQYQRRADLIPNLVSTVKGYAKHESKTLESVIAARAKATQITVDANSLTPEKLKEFQTAQGELSQALGRLMVVKENYPELKANENFSELQAQLVLTKADYSITKACKLIMLAQDVSPLISLQASLALKRKHNSKLKKELKQHLRWSFKEELHDVS